MERRIAAALHSACVPFEREDQPSNTARLDFFLPEHDLYIEVKRFHSSRIADQMSRAANVIAIQGEVAVDAFCRLLANQRV